jgi:hypothetical protein
MVSAGFVHWKIRFSWLECSMHARSLVVRSSFDGKRPRRMTLACTRLNNTSGAGVYHRILCSDGNIPGAED